MKKLTSLIAILLVACVAVQADVLFEETLSTRRGSTYIDMVPLSSYDAWPYANQWFTGYNGKSAEVAGNQFDNDYDDVKSYTCSVRGKKVNEQADNTVGLYFGANKAAEQCYVKFVGALPEVEAGAELNFEICSTEADGGDLTTMAVKVDETEVDVPATTLGAKLITSTVKIALPAGQIDSLKFSFNNVPSQKFITRFWITDNKTAINNVNAENAKAAKVIENGQLFIIRNGVKYNAAGAIVK